MGQKKRYTEEFKRELGLSAGLLHHWRKRFQVNTTSNALELSEVEQLKLDLRETNRHDSPYKGAA